MSGEVEEHVLALIRDGELFARVIFRLPGRGELDANRAPQRAHVVGRERGIEAVEQKLRDVLLLAQDGAAGGFGRMRREHGLDVQLPDELQHILELQPFDLQPRQGILHATGLRANAVLDEVLAAAADAVDLLREIHHLEPGGEGAHQIARNGGRPILDERKQLGVRLGVAVTPVDGGHAVLLHEIQELGATLLQQDLADQRAEGVHVLAQRFVLRREIDLTADHGPGISTLRGSTTSKRWLSQQNPPVAGGLCRTSGRSGLP